ncbi:hypothetical protein [Methylobacterium variabile]|jgi:hypothetical protein|nr:hypothetical protein [Methylobacterium variabile]
MRHTASAFLATFLMCAPAAAGDMAGAADGQYRAQDGSVISVSSADGEVGIQLLSCKRPVVSAGRLKSSECWANGHAGGGIDVSWRVEGNVVVSDGKRHVLLPPFPPLPKAGPADPFEPTPEAWAHNGSGVKVDPKSGTITYMIPKPGLKGIVKPGAVIFEGGVRTSGIVLGTAYAFKQGCPPASYPVRGVYSHHNERLTLTGPGPKRDGCEVVAYSWDSPHAKLVFEYVVGD